MCLSPWAPALREALPFLSPAIARRGLWRIGFRFSVTLSYSWLLHEIVGSSPARGFGRAWSSIPCIHDLTSVASLAVRVWLPPRSFAPLASLHTRCKKIVKGNRAFRSAAFSTPAQASTCRRRRHPV